ncbi:hypothetical protein AVEN_8743-1 [Araneus ventricosus]|uniref:Uncharacterized protein n=1 Tax=Araneus ventricosus TaxID=182803 RepID=A0A4Y2LZM4_ARAVE|nr:hypothetical protein AVEN_8743-1 [Araneus ventricosus]
MQTALVWECAGFRDVAFGSTVGIGGAFILAKSVRSDQVFSGAAGNGFLLKGFFGQSVKFAVWAPLQWRHFGCVSLFGLGQSLDLCGPAHFMHLGILEHMLKKKSWQWTLCM